MKNKYSPNYKKTHNKYKVRLIALRRVLTCTNFILIDFEEFGIEGNKGRNVRPLYRTNYDKESEILTLVSALNRRIKNLEEE